MQVRKPVACPAGVAQFNRILPLCPTEPKEDESPILTRNRPAAI